MTSTNPPPKPPAVRLGIFDMDGLLINSEDLYTQATNDVLAQYYPDPSDERHFLPWSVKIKLQGRPGKQASDIFYSWAGIPDSERPKAAAQTAKFHEKYFSQTEVLPGVQTLIETLGKSGVRIALATSSHTDNFKLKTKHLGRLFDHFPERQRVLGDDKRVAQGRGKPAPDIFLLALKTVNEELQEKGEKLISTDECLVFEDSVPGVEAGRRAGMQVCWCPHPGLLGQLIGREQEVLAGRTGEFEGGDKPPPQDDLIPHGSQPVGAPGGVEDGWAVLLKSLEDFPYEKFSIGKRSSL